LEAKAPLPLQLVRQGVVLRPDPDDSYERGGVLNPAAVLHNGITYIHYRAVAEWPPNYSRILIATCELGAGGNIETTRLGRIALEPEADYEVRQNDKGGGVEDPRITPLDGTFYMAYTAYGMVDGRLAPRIALARSDDLFAWERLGLASFSPLDVEVDREMASIDLTLVPNKDAILFPERIGGRYCMMHRPMFPAHTGLPQSIWLSWSGDLLHWDNHQLVLPPTLPWESLKVGGGTPPLRSQQGWLTFYHGVEGIADTDPNRRYHAGAFRPAYSTSRHSPCYRRRARTRPWGLSAT
jgi:beta-1,2-mannobiose phosphorylase / 1,2-beta-oligomannan phosphorylase